jgi:C-terminal processing protease CtpA/Prc
MKDTSVLSFSFHSVICKRQNTRAFAASLIVFPFFVLLSACHVFLGPEPDAGPQAVLRSLWNDFNEVHAYIDVRMSDNPDFKSWDDVYEHYSNKLLNRIPAGSPSGDRDGAYLFEACGGMIGELRDPHVSLFAPGGNYFWFKSDDIQRTEERWFNPTVIKKNYLEDQGIDKGVFFTYGRIKFERYNNIGYIHIASFIDSDKLEQQDWAREIDGIMEFFQDDDIKAIVIDIRNNSGGSGQIAEYIAARFTSVQKNYMKARVKNGPGRNDFSSPMTFRVRPDGTRFTKHTALLTNRATVSAAEWFAMALKTQGHVRHMGTTTRGAFSPKTSRPMINGWYYTISAYRVTDMSGKCYEGTGIEPEFISTGSFGDDATSGANSGEQTDMQLDGVLEEVLRWLNP